MDLRDLALPHLRTTRKVAADLLAIIHTQRRRGGTHAPVRFEPDPRRPAEINYVYPDPDYGANSRQTR